MKIAIIKFTENLLPFFYSFSCEWHDWYWTVSVSVSYKNYQFSDSDYTDLLLLLYFHTLVQVRFDGVKAIKSNKIWETE